MFAEDEPFAFDVDRRTPIFENYQLPFRFQGKLAKLTVELRSIKATIACCGRLSRSSQF